MMKSAGFIMGYQACCLLACSLLLLLLLLMLATWTGLDWTKVSQTRLVDGETSVELSE